MSLGSQKRDQLRVLLLLIAINFINYVDRQIVFPLFPFIRKDFGLTFLQLGSLATAFTLVLSLGSLPLGMLADRTSRKKVIRAGVLIWSIATFLSGLSTSFRGLLGARALVGVGEAAYTPAGTAIISGTFPRELRARVQGFFDLGMFAGGAVGIALGGVIAQWLGWRAAFFIVGVPGFLLALLVGRLPEPPRVAAQKTMRLRELVRVPAYLMLLASGWFASFAGYAYVAWSPEVVQDYKGFSSSQAGLALGVIVVVAGLSGIATGAALSDRLARRWAWGRISIVPVGFLLSAPLSFIALHASNRTVFLTAFALAVYFLSWYHGPVTATIHDLIPSHGHATAMGLYYFFVNFFAMAVAPLAIGGIADRTNLLSAMHTAVIAQLTGGVLFLGVIYFIRRDGLAVGRVAPTSAGIELPGGTAETAS
ncbi:MAG TPA: MFS transporter [Terriglobales bacterium]|nr:MFS transporter [Terriglobales bacterium]